jgi:thiamine biosynthesis lipoprotein
MDDTFEAGSGPTEEGAILCGAMVMRGRVVIGCGLLVLVWWSGMFVQADGPALMRYTFTEPHMGTTFRIVLYAADEPTANRAAQAAFLRIAELDDIMSDYRPASELMQLCARAGGEPIPVSEDLFRVLQRGQEIAALSDGAFDVTVGPLSRLWRASRKSKKLPSPEELARARALVGPGLMKLDATKRTVQLARDGMVLDLGGIAKGYAADAGLAVLKRHGVDRALVAASGDIAVSGPPPDADGWTIAIRPLESDETPPRALLLKDAAVSTSGDAEQFVEIEGKRYSHILDPRTGLGLVGRMSVTVVAKQGLWSDPLTKVVCVLGTEQGLPLLEKLDGVACLAVRQGEKGLERVESKRFRDLPRTKAEPPALSPDR